MAKRLPTTPTVRSAFEAYAKKFSAPPRPRSTPEENPEPPTRELSPPEIPIEGPPAEPLYALNVPEDPPPASPRVAKLRDLHNRLTSPAPSCALDWRAALAGPLDDQNIEKIKQAGVIPAQYKVLELSQEAESEQIQLQASQFILAQNGHGAVQKTDVKVEYEQVPPNQLLAIIRAKLQKLRAFNPEFDLNQIVEIPAVAESTPAPVES